MSSTSIETLRLNPGILTLIGILLGISILYSIVVMGSLLFWLIPWVGALFVGLTLFVVYLLYRLVVAIETIAAKM